MLGKLPWLVGRTLRKVRPGLDRIVSAREGITSAPLSITLESPAFANNDSIPRRFTADGEGSSPPLRWSNVPEAAQMLLLIVEDADSPTPSPLVHAIVTGLVATPGEIQEGALVAHSPIPPLALGKNSYFKPGWLAPDPPPGHGDHRYAFQMFALDHVPELAATPGRSALVDATAGHTVARGMLIGTYRR